MPGRQYVRKVHRYVGFLAAPALLLLITGCSGPVVAIDSTPPTVSAAAPTPTATSAVLPKPELAFGGACDAIFADAEVSSLAGTEVAEIGEATSDGGWAAEVLGGVNCTWADATGRPFVWLTVIPATGLDETIADASVDQPWCYGGDSVVGADGTCSFSTLVDGYWLAGVFNVADGSGLLATDGIEALAGTLGARAAAIPAAAPMRSDAMWREAPDCSEFASRVGTTSILGGVELEAEPGSKGGEAGPGFYGALAAVGNGVCVWSSAEGQYLFTSEIMPGAGWAVQELIDRGDATAVSIEGAAAAASASSVDHATSIYATDGVNLAWLTFPAGSVDPGHLPAFVSAVIAAAGSA